MMLSTGFLVAQTKKTIKPVSKTVAKPIEEKIVSYEVLNSGDTVNRLDAKNNKVGKWLITKESKYGEEGFMEFGVYDKNNKVGTWKTYSLSGQIISIENFKAGRRDGEARYFDNGYLYCVGNFLALRAKYEYDTIMVEDPVTNVSKPVRIKTDVGSVRHGFWTYYTPGSKKIERVVEYQIDEIVYEKDYISKVDSIYLEKKMKSFPHVSNKQSEDVWHVDNNKKKIRYTDIPENAQFVVPNVRNRK